MHRTRVHHVRRRTALLGFVGVLLMAACAPAPSTPGPAAAAPANSAAAPARTLTAALSADINTLDPHMTTTVPTDMSVLSHIYSSLVTYGPDLKLQPDAAESWEATSSTVWRFKLRPGITFPNGEKLDAATVKWNVERAVDPNTKSRVKPWFDEMAEVRAVDDLTVDFVMKTPSPSFPDLLSRFYLLPSRWAKENNPAQRTMGTGPYTLREWVKDDHVTLDRKSGYWGTQPAFQTMTFRVIPESSSRVAGLLAGDLDLITDVAPSDFGRITSSGTATAASTPSMRSVFVRFNALKPPFDDVRVRQALNYAVDKDAIIKNVLDSLTIKSNGQVLTDAYQGYNPSLAPYPYDVAKAKQLLAEAGVSGSLQVDFDIPAGRYLLGEQISQAVAGQLEQVGVSAKLNEMPFSVYMDRYLTQRTLGNLSYIGQSFATPDGAGLLELFTIGNQYTYWEDQTYTDLVKQARSTGDQAQRVELLQQAGARMREQAPVIFLFPEPATYAVSSAVDWKARPDGWVRAMDARPK